MTSNAPKNAQSYRLRILEKIKPYFSGDSLLDAGCGDGEDAVLMAPFFKKTEAIDLEESVNWKKFDGSGIEFKTGNCEKLNYPVGSFDTVVEKDMLHHAADPVNAVKEMCRVSRKTVIILEANRYNPIFYLHLTLMGGHQHFSQKRFEETIKPCSLPYEIKHFSARVSPINMPFFINLVNSASDLLEKIPFYGPIIEYNMAVITKK
ncbi:MAG: class I SAM-dependent methyltransferase [Candidatus Goldbacteria bacterium]|nr:class I SAM-dependent methyltransferase [Candidatus Goldiibacteriota bacterium]